MNRKIFHRQLISLVQFTTADIFLILHQALAIEQQGFTAVRAQYPSLSQKLLVNLFFEASTRTQYSFITAATRLGMPIINFQSSNSSLEQKRETISDTVDCFVHMRADVLVIRDGGQYLRTWPSLPLAVINAGSGTWRHPTQALLDLLTIYQEFGQLAGLKVLIIGDIKHSRVAFSNYYLMKKMNMQVDVGGPPQYAVSELNNITKSTVQWGHYDVIMMLRYQRERHVQNDSSALMQMIDPWKLTLARMQQLAKRAIILHPGPVNWDVEIASDLKHHASFRIRKQITNGIYIRAALLSLILKDHHEPRLHYSA